MSSLKVADTPRSDVTEAWSIDLLRQISKFMVGQYHSVVVGNSLSVLRYSVAASLINQSPNSRNLEIFRNHSHQNQKDQNILFQFDRAPSGAPGQRCGDEFGPLEIRLKISTYPILIIF